jgi:hypothetical protein
MATRREGEQVKGTKMRINVKPLTHWIIYKGYKVRFKARTPMQVTGVLTTTHGEVEFSYDPAAKVVTLPDARVAINDYGWEVDKV